MASNGKSVNSTSPLEPAARGEEDFLCAYPEKRNPLLYLFNLIRYGGLPETVVPEHVLEQINNTTKWWLRFALFMMEVLQVLEAPMALLGRMIELVGNTVVANGGVLRTLIRLPLSAFFFFKRGPLIIPAQDSVDYRTVIGLIDPRTNLLVDATSSGNANSDTTEASTIFAGPDHGDQGTADVLLMAAKLAYENDAIIKKVVTESWKMNLVGIYDCWNEYQQRWNKQVFVFTDKAEDASAVVVSWRGTAPFSADDWSTDIDFSWFDLQEGMGRVHVGFLEALGLGDRTQMETLRQLRKNSFVQQQEKYLKRDRGYNDKKIPPGSAASGLPQAAKDKILAYDHVTKVVKELLNKNPNAKIFVTGHSLGGALAVLYTGMLYYLHEEEVGDRVAAIYTFGQPRVGDEKYGQFMAKNVRAERFYRVVYGNDVVPRLPFDDLVFNFKHWGFCYYFSSLHYKVETLEEAPNKNYFSISGFFEMHAIAWWELIKSAIFISHYGPEYRESTSSVLFRVLTLSFPGLGAHSPVDYVNSVRLGAPWPFVPEINSGSKDL